MWGKEGEGKKEKFYYNLEAFQKHLTFDQQRENAGRDADFWDYADNNTTHTGDVTTNTNPRWNTVLFVKSHRSGIRNFFAAILFY